MKINKLFILSLTITLFIGSCKKEMINVNTPDVLVSNRDTTTALSKDFLNTLMEAGLKKSNSIIRKK
nr:hypothetical protein [Flavobacterium covae]